MGFVVPFMKRKGGVGASTLARTYAVEAARAGASVIIADLDEMQLTCKRWAEHRKANGLKPEIRAEASTPRKAYDLADTADLLVIDTPPGWDDKQALFLARWSTFCVVPSRGNRMDDLHECVRMLYALRRGGIEAFRYGVALNALRAGTAEQDDADARAYLAEVGFKALPGFTRDLKEYEIALLQGKAITETGVKALDKEAHALANGIAGAVLEAGRQLARKLEAGKTRGKEQERER